MALTIGEHSIATTATLFENLPPGALRLRLLARNGVGFDHIDVDACTRAGGFDDRRFDCRIALVQRVGNGLGKRLVSITSQKFHWSAPYAAKLGAS